MGARAAGGGSLACADACWRGTAIGEGEHK
jgi:hypothetical protein